MKNSVEIVQDELDQKLIEASKSHDSNKVRLLLQQGADPNAKDGQPLINAVKSGYIKTVGILLEHKAHPDVQNKKPLMKAVQRKNADIVGVLLDHGANPNIPNGAILISQLSSYKSSQVEYDIACLLLSYGATGSSQSYACARAIAAKEIITCWRDSLYLKDNIEKDYYYSRRYDQQGHIWKKLLSRELLEKRRLSLYLSEKEPLSVINISFFQSGLCEPRLINLVLDYAHDDSEIDDRAFDGNGYDTCGVM